MEDTSPCFILLQISSFATPVTPLTLGLNPVIHFTMHNVLVSLQNVNFVQNTHHSGVNGDARLKPCHTLSTMQLIG